MIPFDTGGPVVAASMDSGFSPTRESLKDGHALTVIPGLSGDIFAVGSETGLARLPVNAHDLVDSSIYVDGLPSDLAFQGSTIRSQGALLKGSKTTTTFAVDALTGHIRFIDSGTGGKCNVNPEGREKDGGSYRGRALT